MNIDELRGQLLARVRLAGRSVRHLRKSAAESVQHPEVMDRVHDGGDLTPRFALMTILSCGIAILGLLQNSVAVIIGAMLVSPLMGPIVALGFSLTTVDYRQMKRSVVALGIGLVVALLMSIVIVSFSPTSSTCWSRFFRALQVATRSSRAGARRSSAWPLPPR
jgi:uncharacterized membrane protein